MRYSLSLWERVRVRVGGVPNYRGDRLFVSLIDRCRELRRQTTDAETMLWLVLRNRQIAGAKFRRQHQFGPYILDFFCLEWKLSIEADGGQHALPDHATKDALRTRYLEERGVRVLRFTDVEILKETETVVEMIWQAVISPSP